MVKTKVVFCKALCKYNKNKKCTLKEISIFDDTSKYDNFGKKKRYAFNIFNGVCGHFEYIYGDNTIIDL